MVNSGGGNGGTESQRQSSLGEAAATRLRRLQRLCSRTNSNDSLPEALLFIGGVDGKFNGYSQAVIKYLFLGTTGRDLRNTEISLKHEALEDCVLVVRRHDVQVLYSQEAEATVLPVIARWPRCQEYVLPEEDGCDNDIFELHKVRAFRRMVMAGTCGGASLGIPLPRGCDDFRDIEMWPLVQSFALECGGEAIDQGQGCKFLSMQYKIIDISDGLLRVFGSVDALAVEACVLRGAAGLTNHLSAMRRVLDKARTGPARSSVTEEDLVAPLKLLHDFGVMQDDDAGQADQSTETCGGSSSSMAAATHPTNATAARVHPRVFLGARTSVLRDRNARSSARHTVENTGFGDVERPRHAEHFIVEAEEPSTGLCVCRTHFLATRGETVVALVRAYCSLCAALPAAATACSSRWGTVEQVEDQAVTVASPAVASLNKADPTANWKLEASVRAMDACRASVLGESGGRSTGSGDGSCIMYVKLVLSGSRGAVAVGDSYAVLPQDRRAEGWAGARPSLRAGGEGGLMLLTGQACSAYVSVWGAGDDEEDEEVTCVPLVRALQDKAQLAGRLALGTPLCPEGGGGGTRPQGETPATALFSDLAFAAVDGKLRLFSEGFTFRAAGCVPAVVSMRPATATSLPVVSAGLVEIDGDDGGLFLLLVKFNEASSKSPLAAAFPFLESTEACAFPLLRDSSRLQGVLQALNSWKEIWGEQTGHLGASDVPSAIITALRASPVVSMFDGSAAARERAVRATATELSQAAASVSIAEGWAEYRPESMIYRECGGGIDSSLGHSQRRRDDDDHEDDSSDARGGGVETALRTTVLVGLPGSGVLSLAAAVLRFSSAGVDWTPVMFSPAGEGVDEQEFENAISVAVEGARLTPKSRVIVAVSAEVGAAAVCAMVARWRNAARRLKIECCTACVRFADATPGEGGHERWRPFLVDQCSVGWTSNVVLTGDCSSGNSPSAWAHAHQLRRRLHLGNAGLSFIAECSALYVGREALDSILRGEDAFESKPMLQARIRTFGPSWASLRYPGTRNSESDDVCLVGCSRYPFMSSSSKNIGSLLPSLPPPPNGENSQIFPGARRPDEVDQAGSSTQAKSRAFRNLGAMETWRLVACLSTLFPKARVEKTGVLASTPTLTETETEAGSSSVTAETNHEKGADIGVSGIRRSGELARSKVHEQRRHAREVGHLDLALGRWLKGRRAAHDGYTLDEGDFSTNPCGATPSSVVGLVRIKESACCEDVRDGGKVALLEATSQLITLSGFPGGVFDETANGVGGRVVVRARSGVEADAIGDLLAVACRSPSSAGRHVRRRSDLSESELERLAETHKDEPLPQGWFFDGTVFVDYEGNRRTKRPDMPEIIDRHLEALNKELA